jgi:hypothetical protein
MSQSEQNSAGRSEDAKVEGGDARRDHPDNATIAREAAAIYPDTNAGAPTPEEIAVEAYRLFLGRGGEHGQDVEDWLEAQRRLSRTNGPSEL